MLAPVYRRLTQRAVKATSAAFDRVRPPHEGVVVLIYHRVGRRSSLEVDLPTSLFAEQMAALAERGTATTLDRAIEWLEAATPASPAPTVVTFDDGTADLADVALPILEQYSIPATVYVATDFITRQLPFPANGHPLSWHALADMTRTGLVEVGSHTHTHALLDRLPADQVVEELDRSLGLIAEKVGKHPQHFAYPKAVPPSVAADRAVRSRFRSAALAGTRPNRHGHTDIHQLARSPIQFGDAMRWFEQKIAGGMAFEDDLRRLVNRARYVRSSR